MSTIVKLTEGLFLMRASVAASSGPIFVCTVGDGVGLGEALAEADALALALALLLEEVPAAPVSPALPQALSARVATVAVTAHLTTVLIFMCPLLPVQWPVRPRLGQSR